MEVKGIYLYKQETYIEDSSRTIVRANRVDIFIDYRATSTDQFDGISKIIAVIGV